jgi:hypothetical protein
LFLLDLPALTIEPSPAVADENIIRAFCLPDSLQPKFNQESTLLGVASGDLPVRAEPQTVALQQ